MTVSITFRAVLSTRNEEVAKSTAISHRCSYGFCVIDGMFYVAGADQLQKAPIIDIRTPCATEPAELFS